MKKILLAIDGMSLSTASIDFACYLARVTNSKLTGVFLENLLFEQRPLINELTGVSYGRSAVSTDFPENNLKREKIEKNIELFKNACESRSVSCLIHRDRGMPVSEIVAESRFADVIVVDAETSFDKKDRGIPSDFVKDLLKETECPVILAPSKQEDIEEIIFAYDGTKSSVFAIKQFTYLFPGGLRNAKAVIVQVNEKEENSVAEKHEIKEWLNAHYSRVEFKILHGDTKDELFTYLLNRKNSFVVLGSYGRSDISRFFKHSPADLLTMTLNQPIFIAHC